MPTTQPMKETPPIPAGEHNLTLAEVTTKNVDNLKFIRGDKTAPPKVDKWLWRFLSDDRDEETGEPFELAIWTFDRYGHEKANLTKLLDMLAPKMPTEEKQHLNTDRLIGSRYKAMVLYEKNQSGNMAPVAKYIVPTNDPAPQPIQRQPVGPQTGDTPV